MCLAHCSLERSLKDVYSVSADERKHISLRQCDYMEPEMCTNEMQTAPTMKINSPVADPEVFSDPCRLMAAQLLNLFGPLDGPQAQEFVQWEIRETQPSLKYFHPTKSSISYGRRTSKVLQPSQAGSSGISWEGSIHHCQAG